MQPPTSPITFTPVLKDYVWGGRRFETLFGRSLPPGVVAESWEISAHSDGITLVDEGHYRDTSLVELHKELGTDLVGTYSRRPEKLGKFPLLVKLLDANNHLSIQVHPDDSYALKHEGNELGKTEMWVVLHAEPNAAVVLGVTAGTTPEVFRNAVLEGRLSPHLHRLPVKKGDVVCIPSGSVHAILKGCVLAEIQQNSNTTYRVFDWNRTINGKPRPLHIEKAMDVINFEQVEPGLCRPTVLADSHGLLRSQLCSNSHFVTERLEMTPGSTFEGRCDGSTMEIWGVIDGCATLNGVDLPAIRFALLPAVLGDFSIAALEPSTLLRTYLQSPRSAKPTEPAPLLRP